MTIILFNILANMDISKQPALLQGQFTFNFQTAKLQVYSDCIRFKNSQIQCTLPFCFDLSYDVQVKSKQWVLSFYMDPPFEHQKLAESSQHIKFQFMSNEDIKIWDTTLIQFIKRKGFNRRFKQEDMLGRGGYGQVYKIWNFFTSITSAAKVIQIEQIQKSLKRKKVIENEIYILRKIKKIQGNRQNLIEIQGVYEDQNKIYVAMQLIQGKNLREVLVKHRISFQIRKRIMKGILTGLATLCKNNIIHRDIKPENIMLGESGKIKIVDFGFAYELNSELIFKMCGTHGYFAPELLDKDVNQIKPTSKMDVFAAGTILYEMIFRKPLVQGIGYVYHHNQSDLDIEIQKLNVQKSQADLLSKMLVNDPQQRISAEQALKHDYFWKKGLRITKEQNDRKMLTIEKNKQASMGIPIKKVKREKQNRK